MNYEVLSSLHDVCGTHDCCELDDVRTVCLITLIELLHMHV